ncbi:hypothetical protein [Bacillus sp. S/N-304-OC-R1]|uniref:hypothetical protein n=1 Tax=Bacillus sp. S/N-304-OC-R1 TaxID=2758034 RepID=UPI001C8D76B0|nr:hypothetical protein [Bacillus sp. S/N-304-OC-R1]MBY0121674.1 hypothetical protein [Bacillus sp. S/N-304-OC-R1]
MFKEEPELSNEVIRYTKFASLTCLIAIPIILISFIFDILILRFSLVVFPLILILGKLKIYTDDKDL